MNNKYKLIETDFKLTVMGVKVFRIKAKTKIEKFGINKGDLGGYIESEKNLQVSGYAWVSGDAIKTPLHITGMKYHITIADNQISWGCRIFTFDEVKAFEFKDCKTQWNENEFKLNKKIITEMIRYYRSDNKLGGRNETRIN